MSYQTRLAVRRQQQPTWAKYLIGFAAALVASAVTVLFREDLSRVMFIAFWPAVIFTAWFCGLGPSLAVSGIAILVVDYFVLAPTETFSAQDPADIVPLALFFLISTVVNSLAVAADRSRARAESALEDLADRANVLEEQAGELEMQREALRSQAEELEDSVAELEAANRGAETARSELSDVLTALPDATIVYDAEWRATFLNPAAEIALRASGIEPQTVLGRALWEVFDEQASNLRAAAKHVQETGEMLDFEHSSPLNNRWYHHRLLKTNSGFVVHSRDVTHERAAAEARERLAMIVDSSDDAIFAKTLDGTISSWNAGAERMLGYTADEIVGQSVRVIIPADLEGEEQRIIASLRRGEPIHHYDTVRLRKDGRRVDVSISVAPIRDASGIIIGASTIARDISERKRMEAEERSARVAAEAANRAKSNFLAVMSHELRTPLNAIAGYVELLEMGLRGPLTDAQRTDLMRIRRSQVNLLALIDDVLQFARIESGRFVVDSSPVAIDALLSDLRTFIEPQLIEKQLRFVYHGCDPTLTVRLDGEKVGQIVINLLTNAVKFTGQGGTIELACNVDGEAVEISVRDTGQGIAGSDLERIFEPFVQLDMGPTRTVHGTGLGLAISRDLAQAMGGSIVVNSRVGAGSVFTLRVPRNGTPSGARHNTAQVAAAGH